MKLREMSYLNNGNHVFIVGSARSGTSLMGSILQASREVAVYRAETLLLYSCRDKYGDLEVKASRDNFTKDWLKSRQFKRSGLSKEEAVSIIDENRSYVGVLGAYMNMVADKQNCNRWVDSTPSYAYCIEKILHAFPNAKIIHMIRDGRAVSLSLAKLGWSGSNTSNFDRALQYSSLKWQQALEAASNSIKAYQDRCIEVRYEDLVQKPKRTLDELEDFLQLPDLTTQLFQDESSGMKDMRSTLNQPNTPFGDMSSGISQNAIYRWKEVLSKKQVRVLESIVGNTLEDHGYELVSNDPIGYEPVSVKLYRVKTRLKHVLKQRTLLGRFIVSPLEIYHD